MKAIKICKNNSAIIREALNLINGSAGSHTLNSFSEIENIAEKAEVRVLGLVACKKNMPGAVIRFTSGSRMPNAYKYNRIGTTVELTRKSQAWFLSSIKRVQLNQRGGGPATYLFTPQQVELAVQNFKSNFSVLPG
jgi:hypothetical protein